MKTLIVTATDDRYSVRENLDSIRDEPVVVILPWEANAKNWDHPLDYELLLRDARDRAIDIAWVIEDPQLRPIAHAAGFRVFPALAAAETYHAHHARFPLRGARIPNRPQRPWYAAAPKRPKQPKLTRQPAWVIALELVVLVGVLITIAGTLVIGVPSAKIVVYPSGFSYSRIVAVSVDADLQTADPQTGTIPTRRVGEEFEAAVEVPTSGQGFSFTGRAIGQVLFTNLLGQDYRVPEDSVVRTTSGSYPVRYRTTAEIVIPAFGQATAPVEALEEGPSGNVDAYQINLVEGVVGFAVRVTNPSPISGAVSKSVAAVSQADRDRAWEVAAEQVLAQAYNGLQDLLEPGEFLPQQALVVQAVPKQAYTHLVGEQSPTLGLALRLLISAQAVKAADVQAVALRQLVAQLPEGHTLTDARFSYGEAAEEDVGPGDFTFYVTAQGYATADITEDDLRTLVLGLPLEEAVARLEAALPLVRPPEITVQPAWFGFVPLVPLRIDVEIIYGDMQS